MRYLILLLIPFTMACEDAIIVDVNKVTSIQYFFRDSSVPPRYHRSYKIRITPDSAHVSVTSYGDQLADETYEVQSDKFSELIELINSAKLISGSVESEPGCTGGTGESLIIKEGSVQVYKGAIDNCGGTTIPAEMGDIKKVIETIKAFIPNLRELCK